MPHYRRDRELFRKTPVCQETVLSCLEKIICARNCFLYLWFCENVSVGEIVERALALLLPGRCASVLGKPIDSNKLTSIFQSYVWNHNLAILWDLIFAIDISPYRTRDWVLTAMYDMQLCHCALLGMYMHIFTRLKLCLATATPNFKWVKNVHFLLYKEIQP